MERETGIEPAPSAWKAELLPLNYSRGLRNRLGGGRWIRTTEGVSQQIYSLPPLAAWVSLRSSLRKPVKQPAILTCTRRHVNGGHGFFLPGRGPGPNDGGHARRGLRVPT